MRLLLSVPVALAAVPAVAHAGSLRLDTVGCQGVNGVTDNTFTVPAGVTSLSVTAHGAAGGGSTGGQGQWITGTINVSPGAKLYACVDEGGGVGGTSGTGPHGSNGGGYALLSNAQDFSSPYVIAGGGGGAGGATGLGVAGAGGRAAGSSAGTAGGDSGGGTGGQPADANGAGLKGENADNPLANGHNGVIRKGGKGGDGQNGGSGGGGGGGGVWGGGGGGASNGAANGVHSSAAGGGGGNSYCDMASCAYAYAGGGAYVDLTWVDPPATTTTSVSATTNPTPRDAAIEFEATISPVPSGGSVSFTMNGQLLQPCLARPVDTTTGKATCTYTAPPTSGTHTVKASYGGTTGFVASDDESSFTVSAPKATLSPGTVDFGAVTLGDKPTRTVTVSNTGTHDLSVFPHGVYIADTQGLALLGAPPKSTDFTVAADTCSGTTVAPGGTCTVSVAFKPTVVGARTAELLVDTDSETIVTELALNGTGKLPAPPEPETTPTPDPTPTPTPPVAPTPPAAPAEPAKAAPLKVAVSIPGVPKPSAKSKAALPVDPGKPLTVGCDTSAELDSCGVKLTVTVRGKQVVIGQATTKPGQQSVQIKLNATGRRLLADAPAGLKVRVAITGRSAEGVQTATASTTLVAKRTVTLLDGFAVNSAELSAKGRDFVDALARELKGDAPKRIVVTGHTDSSGPASDEYRKALGLSRAKAIAERLRERGVDSQFVTKSAADTAPAASEATAAGKAANRRVTLELQR